MPISKREQTHGQTTPKTTKTALSHSQNNKNSKYSTSSTLGNNATTF
jgi:hypothetical protein